MKVHITGPHQIASETCYKVAVRDAAGIVIENRIPQFWLPLTYLKAYAMAHNIARDRGLEVVDEAKEVIS